MAWEEIVDYTVPSNTTSVTLNNFGTITKDDFIKITCSLSSASSLSAAYYQLFVNTDETNSNYFRQELQSFGTTVESSRNDFPNIGITVNNSTTTINTFLKISQNDKVNTFSKGSFSNSSDIRVMYDYTTSITNHPSITSITIKGTSSTGAILSDSIVANSRIQIYKLTAQKVADITVASTTTQVDITGLDIKKGDEYLLVSDINLINGSNLVNLFVNNNITRTNYYSQILAARGTEALTARANYAEYIGGGTNNSLNNLVYSHIKLSNIGAYTAQNYGLRYMGTSSIDIYNASLSSTFENLTSISSINIRGESLNMINTGTRFQLYKLYEGGN